MATLERFKLKLFYDKTEYLESKAFLRMRHYSAFVTNDTFIKRRSFSCILISHEHQYNREQLMEKRKAGVIYQSV